MKRLTAIAVGFAAIVCAAFGLAPKFSVSAETAAAMAWRSGSTGAGAAAAGTGTGGVCLPQARLMRLVRAMRQTSPKKTVPIPIRQTKMME